MTNGLRLSRLLLFGTMTVLLMQSAVADKPAVGSMPSAAETPSRQEPLWKILGGSPAYPFRPGYPDDKGGSGNEEHNLLTVPQTRMSPNDSFSVDIRVYNDGGFDYFYNVYWNRLLTLPGAVALYDAKKHYLGDLMGPRRMPGTSVEFFGGSRATPSSNDWTPIQSPGYAGTTLDCGPLSVPPGIYYVQVIFFTSLVHPPPDRSDVGWPPLDDRTEIMRSEAIQITVTEPKAVRSVYGTSATSKRKVGGGSMTAPSGTLPISPLLAR